jgi:hypothetical protein
MAQFRPPQGAIHAIPTGSLKIPLNGLSNRIPPAVLNDTINKVIKNMTVPDPAPWQPGSSF